MRVWVCDEIRVGLCGSVSFGCCSFGRFDYYYFRLCEQWTVFNGEGGRDSCQPPRVLAFLFSCVAMLMLAIHVHYIVSSVAMRRYITELTSAVSLNPDPNLMWGFCAAAGVCITTCANHIRSRFLACTRQQVSQHSPKHTGSLSLKSIIKRLIPNPIFVAYPLQIAAACLLRLSCAHPCQHHV
jgi:hypothetical protein